MSVQITTVGDLIERVNQPEYGKIRDRMRSVIYRHQGRNFKWIGKRVGHSQSWVKRWVDRFKKEGLDGLYNLPKNSSKPRLTEVQCRELKQRVLSGPSPEEQISVYRSRDIQQWIKEQFGIQYGARGVRRILRRLGLSFIRPRSLHEKNDPNQMMQWCEKTLPFFLKEDRTRKSRQKNRGRVRR